LKLLTILFRILYRDIYNLIELEFPTENIKPPELDLLAVSRYLCVY
jgi:hypothetical protein